MFRPLYRLKQLQDIARAFRIYRGLKKHESWTRGELEAYQCERVRLVVRQAATNSRFYRDLYKGIDLNGDFLLESLPVVDKATMQERFDDIVGDPRLKRFGRSRPPGRTGGRRLFHGPPSCLGHERDDGREGDRCLRSRRVEHSGRGPSAAKRHGRAVV